MELDRTVTAASLSPTYEARKPEIPTPEIFLQGYSKYWYVRLILIN